MYFKRIEEMRVDSDLTIKEISIILGIHRDVYSRYEKGLRSVPIDILIRLADLYDCSIDYLVGRTDLKINFSDFGAQKKNNPSIFFPVLIVQPRDVMSDVFLRILLFCIRCRFGHGQVQGGTGANTIKSP